MNEVILFKTFCIESYRQKYGLSGKETYDLFVEKDVLGYIERHFDVLHTQGESYIVDDIHEYILCREE